MMWASLGRAPRLELRGERLDVDAVRLERNREDLGAELAQREQRAVVGRRLDHHDVAGLDQLVEQERVGLHRAVGGEQPVGLDAVLLRRATRAGAGSPGEVP